MLALVVLTGTLLGPSTTSAQSGDPRAERERVRSEKAGVAAAVDALRADQTEVSSALAALDENLRGQQAAFADAERALAQAEQAVEEARAAAAAKGQEIEDLRTQVATLAVDAYVNPPTQDFLSSFEAGTASEAARKRSLMALRAGRDMDLLDSLRLAEDQLQTIHEEAEEASELAAQHRESVGDRLAELDAARDQQAAFVSQVNDRLEAKLAESAALAEIDQELSKEIAAQEAAIAEKLRQEAQARNSRSSSSSSGSASTSSSSSSSYSASGVGNTSVTNVRGFYVANSVAAQTESMLAAAAAAGFTFGGHAYRDPSNQISLRRQNCGTSDYAVYQMPASQCSPATAIPGRSKHERGLAMDLTWNGSTLRYGSAAFQWLAANAGSYGYVNDVPGEPWHWSVGGG